MFEKSLKEKLERIFDLPATFAEPGESNEQEKLFIEVSSSKARVKDGRSTCLVEAKVSIFGNADKLTFGFFAKQIDKATAADKIDLFFFDIDQSERMFQNIVQRSFSLIYFYDSQYDPEQGTITTIEIEVTE